MRRTNLLELKSGVNKIVFTHEDFSITNSKTPIAILPAGAKLLDVFINNKIPFKTGNFPNQSNSDSSIIARNMVGTKDDTQVYLKYMALDSIGKLPSNNGSYFNNPAIYDSDIELFLETWLSPRVWSIGGDMLVGRYALACCGSQSAGLNFGGIKVAAPVYADNTEEYNGSSWSAGGALSQYRHSTGGAGTQTAGLIANGNYSGVISSSEEYNGATWSGGGATNQGCQDNRLCGTQNAALTTGGGGVSSSPIYSITEEYNGASWSSSQGFNIQRMGHGCMGTSDGCIITSGKVSTGPTVSSDTTELYNGLSWSIVNSTNGARLTFGDFGGQNSGTITGGNFSDISDTYITSITEDFDGITWFISNNLNNPLKYNAGTGTQTAGLTMGGFNDSDYSTDTEEYDSADMSTTSIDGSLTLTLTVV